MGEGKREEARRVFSLRGTCSVVRLSRKVTIRRSISNKGTNIKIVDCGVRRLDPL